MKKLVAVILLALCAALATANLADAYSFSGQQTHGSQKQSGQQTRGWHKHRVQIPPDGSTRE